MGTAIRDIAGIGTAIVTKLGNGDGTFDVSYNLSKSYDLISADFNEDGKDDLLLAGEQETEVFTGTGNGTFNSPYTIQTGEYVNSMVYADLDGDHVKDLAVSSNKNIVVTLKGDGTGYFSYPKWLGTGFVPMTLAILTPMETLTLQPAIFPAVFQFSSEKVQENSDGLLLLCQQHQAGQKR